MRIMVSWTEIDDFAQEILKLGNYSSDAEKIACDFKEFCVRIKDEGIDYE